MESVISRIVENIPPNPYPVKLFPMTVEDYVRAIPDPTLRTAVSGSIGRWAYDVASEAIVRALRKEFEFDDIEEEKKSSHHSGRIPNRFRNPMES